jgi:glycosyltransferase involved in cell wall biosynthesis
MKFSIIIPTYNRINFLQKALESISVQTYQNYEIIVVNDNPPDKRAIDELAKKFEKITVIHHPSTRGGNAARNSGILYSTGDLIAFLDDDDTWLPEKLSKHLEAHIQQPEVGLVFSDCLYVYNSPLIANHATSSHVPADVIEAMGKAKFCPATSSIVSITRECIIKCGLFDENLASFQDWDYWFRIAHHFRFFHIPVILVYYRQHLRNRTSINEDKRKKGLSQIHHKWESEIYPKVFLKSWKRILYYNSSLNSLMAGQKFAALRKSMRLLKKDVIGKKAILSFLSLWASIFFDRKRRNFFL